MKQHSTEIQVATAGKGLYDFTAQVSRWVRGTNVNTGLLTIFIQHTSASLVIQENADPDVVFDLNEFFSRVAPESDRLYKHNAEGPDDMPAHIRAALTQTQLSIPLIKGSLALGTWQGLYVFEHRATPHRRSLTLHLIGE